MNLMPNIPTSMPKHKFQIGDLVRHNQWMSPLIVVDIDIITKQVMASTIIHKNDIQEFIINNVGSIGRVISFPRRVVVEIEYPETDLDPI